MTVQPPDLHHTTGRDPPRFIASLTSNANGTWSLVRQARDTYVFNNLGQLVSATDLNGYSTTYAYTSGQLTSITDSSGRSLSIAWTGSHITSVTDANVSGTTRTVTYQYNDGNGNLTDVIDLGGGHTSFVYDSSHRITVMKDAVCYSTVGCPGVQNDYDANGRVDWQKDQMGRQTTFAYSGDPQSTDGGTTVITDPSGHQRQDGYQQGVRTFETVGYGTPAAATTFFGYDVTSMALTSQIDANHHRSTFTVDSNGNVLTATDAMGHVTIDTYNAMNQLATTKDPAGVTTTYSYDARGNLTSSSTPLTGGGTRQITFLYGDPTHPGDVTQETDPNGNVTSFHYNSYGDRDEVKDAAGHVSASRYNADGWMTATYSGRAGCSWNVAPPTGCASGYETDYGYTSANSTNQFGDVVTISDPLSQVVRVTYNANRQRTGVTDANGNGASTAYDLAGERCWTVPALSPGSCGSPPSGATTFTYDGAGHVTSSTDANGNVTSSAYDDRGELCWTVLGASTNSCAAPPAGAATRTYDPAGNLVTTADPVGNVTSAAYNADNQLCWTISGYSGNACGTPPTGAVVMSYDTDGRSVATTDQNGNITTTSYDTLGQVCWTFAGNSSNGCTAPPTGSTSYGYDKTGNTTSVTDPNGNVSTATYSPVNQLCWTIASASTANCIAPPSGASMFSYDADGNRTSTTDPNGNVATTAYDATNRICWTFVGSTSNACGTPPTGATAVTYDAAGNPISITDPDGRVQSSAYDSQNRVCWTYAGTSSNGCATVPIGSTAYTYDGNGNAITMVDPNGNPFSKAYNARNQLCWSYIGSATGGCSSPPLGATTYAYDNDGHVTHVTDPDGHVVTSAYDNQGRVCWVLAGMSSNPCASAPANAKTYTYDGVGNALKVTQPDGATLLRAYDKKNQVCWSLVGGTSINGCANPPAGATAYTYDNSGNPLTVVDPNGNVTTHAYDTENRPCWTLLGSSANACGSVPSGATSYTYDNNGNVIRNTQPSGATVTSAFDSHDRPCWIYQGTSPTGCASPPTGSAQFTYDNGGHILTTSDADGAITTRTYDAKGELCWSFHGATSNGCGSKPAGATGYTYDNNGNVAALSYPSGGLVISQAYNARNRPCWTAVSSITTNGPCGVTPNGAIGYAYDPAGKLLSEALPNGVTNSYSYDAADGIAAISDTKGQATVFTATYSRNASELVTQDSSQPSAAASYQYTPKDQVCYAAANASNGCGSPPAGATPYAYDAAGNLVNDNGTTQAYDAKNELCWTLAAPTAAPCTSPPTGATIYRYDANGNRQAKVPSAGSATCTSFNSIGQLTSALTGSGSSCTSPTLTATYAYDALGLRKSKTVNGTTTNYDWNVVASLPELIQETTGGGVTSYVYGPTGAPIEQVAPSGSRYFYSHDALGSTRALTDSSGAVVATAAYDPYGNITASTGSLANDLLYAGEYRDAETGMYYLRTRYYDPLTAQFVSIDPAVATTHSPYGYAVGDPVNLTDPTGLAACPGALVDGECIASHPGLANSPYRNIDRSLQADQDARQYRACGSGLGAITCRVGTSVHQSMAAVEERRAAKTPCEVYAAQVDFQAAAMAPAVAAHQAAADVKVAAEIEAQKEAAQNQCSNALCNAWAVVQGVWSADTSFAKGVGEGAWNVVAGTGQFFWNCMGGAFVSSMEQTCKGYVTGLLDVGSDLIHDPAGTVKKFWQACTSSAEAMGQCTVYIAAVVVGPAKTGAFVDRAIGTGLDASQRVAAAVGSGARSAGTRIAGAIRSARGAAADTAAKVGNGIADAANAAKSMPPGWELGPATRDISEQHWYDPNGGEWRWHAPDKWHDVGHWDHNPWDQWNSPWQHIYPDGNGNFAAPGGG